MFATLALLTAAQATSLATLDMAQLTDAADVIVRGTVTEIWTERDDAGMVWTVAQVEVASVFKGDDDTELLLVSQPGGQWGDRATHVLGVARFSVGEDTYLFVDQNEAGRTLLVGMFQGKFNTQMDPHARELVVTRFPVAVDAAFDHRFIPLPPADKRVTLSEFEVELIEMVADGWDGRPIPGLSSAELRRINGM